MKASSEPRTMTITSAVGNQQLAFKDVLVGEVWLCSGQSNMAFTLSKALNAKEEVAAANYPMIRLLITPQGIAPVPQHELSVKWEECSPKGARGFTAAGYFFGRKLHKELGVPIGLIDSSMGGTRITPWTSPEGLRMVPELRDIAEKVDAFTPSSEAGKKAYREVIKTMKAWIPQAEAAVEAGEQPPTLPNLPAVGTSQKHPTTLYNARIHPLVPYALRGVLWYQGEANGGDGEFYIHKMKALINGWRKVWGQEMSFYFVQLADYRAPNENPKGGGQWTELREAQRKALALPKTGMAVITDVGDATNVHPKNKQDVGYRLSLWALAHDYPSTKLKAGGMAKDLIYSGPLYKGHKVENGKIRISFDHVGSGLMAGVRKEGLEPTAEDKSGVLKHFAIAGKDKKWVWADAVIDGNTVMVSSKKVPDPVAVRYAFADNPQGANLYNKEGLPASPFRTDDW